MNLPQPRDPGQLDEFERKELAACEAIVKQGLRTFFDVGESLVTIRKKRLYREHFDTWEEYCWERFQISRSYAHRLTAAAEVVKLLPIGNTLPTNESQIRPLIKLPPRVIPDAWQEILFKAGDRNITARLVQSVVSKILPVDTSSNRTATTKRLPPRGEKRDIGIVLNELRQSIIKGQKQKSLRLLNAVLLSLKREKCKTEKPAGKRSANFSRTIRFPRDAGR